MCVSVFKWQEVVFVVSSKVKVRGPEGCGCLSDVRLSDMSFLLIESCHLNTGCKQVVCEINVLL